MSGLDAALSRSSAMISSTHAQAMRVKGAGFIDIGPSSGLGQLSNFQESGAQRARYAQFRGVLYSVVNIIAMEGAGQPVHVGRLKGSQGKGKGKGPANKKSAMLRRMTATAQIKAAKEEIEIVPSHPLVDLLETPNPIQNRWQFVYSFIANLNLTGWAYVVGGENDDGEMEFYSLPTTWCRPDHTNGPFSGLRIINPKNPTEGMQGEPLTRENFAFAHLPNPADPMGAMAPAQSQMLAIRIDDHIQTSQERFFENGIFPSVIVTIGHDPHPDVPGGVRPRLTGPQRRQVIGAIRKAVGGVANYGNPAIVDGLIEKIDRLSATSNEMGWEKSESSVKARILSTFGVHPYILGENVSVGGYAQAAKIEERFCKRVNTFLDMLGGVMTNFVAPMKSDEKRKEDLMVWWEPAAPSDPGLHWQNVREGRKNGDVSRNEYRMLLGLPPDETGGDRTKNFTSGDMAQILALQAAVAGGTTTPEQAAATLEVCFDLSHEDAVKLAGTVTDQQAATNAAEQATSALEAAVSALQTTEIESAVAKQIALRISSSLQDPQKKSE